VEKPFPEQPADTLWLSEASDPPHYGDTYDWCSTELLQKLQ
jgi:hypothetical protein